MPGIRRPPVHRRALRALRALRSLRARLIAGLLVLLAVCCGAVGVTTVLSFSAFLTQRLDQQLIAAGGRFPASLEHGSPDPESGNSTGETGTRRADTRGQAPGTLGVRLVGGQVRQASVVRGGDGHLPDLTAADRAALARIPADDHAHSVDLTHLRRYRLAAVRGDDHDTLLTGLPMHDVEEDVHRLEAVEAVVFTAAILATGVTGALWVRASLRPLLRVADIAERVALLPLADGAVDVPERVPDTDPATEVGRVGTAFNRMLGHVEDALARRQASEERLRAFAADASHELRTPVASIRGHAELARRHPGPVPDEVRHALDRIGSESGRMGGIVDDLLLLARLDAGRPLAGEPVDLTRLVLDAAGDARAAGPDHRWELDLPEQPVTVTGDAHRLQQVIANLLGNARVHTPAGTRVTVAVHEPDAGGRALLEVADDGPGIPAELQPTVFERFVRAAPGRTHGPLPGGGRAAPGEGGGTGLGLAIVSAVVAAHGGTAEVESAPGRTVFRVRLPAGPPAAAEPDEG